MPFTMTYFYEYTTIDVSGTATLHTDSKSCKVYKFSNVDTFGAMALCYFLAGTELKYAEQTKDSKGFPTGVYVEKTHTVGTNGEWMSIHVRNLKP